MAPQEESSLNMTSRIPQDDSPKKGSMLRVSSIDIKVDDNNPLCSGKDADNLGTASLELTALEIEAANRQERKRLERRSKRECDFEEFLNNRQESQNFTVSPMDGLSNHDGRKSANQKTRRNAMHLGMSNEAETDNTTTDPDTMQNSSDQFRVRREATCDTVDTTHARRTRQRVMRKRLTFREIDYQSV